jgi:Zn-dependent protease with chaperone function
MFTHRELISIILHESSHVTSKDIIKQLILNMFKFIPIILLDSWLLYLLAPIVTGIIYLSPYKRLNEYTADSVAKKYGYGEDLASALVKISHYYGAKSKDLSSITNNVYKTLEKLVKLLQSHPSLSNRIKKLYNGETPEEFIKKIKTEILEKENIQPEVLQKHFSEIGKRLAELERKRKELERNRV